MLPFSVTKLKYPFEVLRNKPPNYNSMKAFGYQCYVSTTNREGKFSVSALPCIILRHSLTQKGFILYDTKSSKILTNRNVQFHKDIFLNQHRDLMVLDLADTSPTVPMDDGE